MATKTKAKPAPSRPAQRNTVVPIKRNVPATMSAVQQAAAKYAGEGISHRAEDNIVPLVYLLQALSPVAIKGHERYIKGAEAGDIWLRNMPNETAILKSEDGMVFQPCHHAVCWIEWQPDRGGFVSRHTSKPREAKMVDMKTDSGEMRKVLRMPGTKGYNGNIISEHREYAGFVYLEDEEPLPYTISFSGSGHTVARNWMTTMRRERLENGAEAPLYANLWRLTPKLRTKNNNSWYLYEITKEGEVETVEEIERGHALHQAFLSGEKESAAVESSDEAPEAIDNDDDVV